MFIADIATPNLALAKLDWLATKPALEKSLQWQWGITALMTILAIGTFFYALSIARGEKNLTAVYIWLGGALAVFYEPLGDLFAHVTYHEVNQINLFTSFGFKIPLWLAPTYTIAVSASVLWLLQRIKKGITFKSWVTSFFILVPIAIAFELPLLFMNSVQYFGPQPISVLGYPVAMAFTNTAGLIFTNAVILYFLCNSKIGKRWPALFVLLVPMTTAGAHISVSLPWGLAMNGTDNLLLINIAAFISILFSILQMWVGGNLVCSDKTDYNR